MAATLNPVRLDLRSTNMTDHRITRYRQTRAYLLDYKDPNRVDDEILGVEIQSDHDQKIKYMEAVFAQLFQEVEVNRVIFGANATEEDFVDYWRAQLDRCEGDELFIIYFHGVGCKEGEEYSWQFENPPNDVPINAYDFIRMIYTSGVDALFLLDCPIQTRFTQKLRSGLGASRGTVEILAAPAPLRDRNGIVLKHSRDFTPAIAANLRDWVRSLRSLDKQKHKPTYSIPQVLGRDTNMYSNPVRIWLQRPRKNKKRRESIKRFVFDPQLVQLTGKLEVFGKEIQEASDD